MVCIPIWVLVGAYAIHIFEEYRFNWRDWAMQLSKLNLKWSEFFAVNAAVLAWGIVSGVVGYSYPVFSYLFVGLALVNALIAHIGTSIVKHKYSPGTATSIVLFVPVSIWAYFEAYQKGYLGMETIVITIIVGFLIMCIPVGLQILKNKLTMKRY